MENFDAGGMQAIADYARIRIALLGLVRTIFGLLVGVMAGVTLWATAGGDMKPTQPGDMPSWWMYIVGAVLAFVALCFITGGIGRLISAFARDCYFRAGPQGVAIRLPIIGWFGLYRFTDYRWRWDEILKFDHFTNTVNLIPVSRELCIELANGKRVTIKRRFFSASSKEIKQKLTMMQSVAGK